MVPKVAALGDDPLAAGKYHLRDKDCPKDAPTSDRVGWTHTENLPTADPWVALRIMEFTIGDADRLKREAGVRPGGRKREKPVFSFSVAWHPGQKPAKEHMLETAKDAVRALGLSSYQALYVSHNDEPQPHVHVIINRVNVDTGILAPLGNSKNRLSDWALDYQKRHNENYCPQREINAGKRKARKMDRTKPAVHHGDPVITEAWLQSDNGKSFQAALAAHGYRLARGRKRIVVVDRYGKTHNPARRLGIKTAVFNARIADLDLDRLPTAIAMQYQARKQVKHENAANRKWDIWSVKLKNEIQDKQIAERAKLSDRHHRMVFEKRDELRTFYKIDDHMIAIARLKREAADKNLLHILKRRRAETELVQEEAMLGRANERIAGEIEAIEDRYRQDLADLARVHAAQQQRALDAIERKKPEFYREETLKDRPATRRRDRDPERPRESGYER